MLILREDGDTGQEKIAAKEEFIACARIADSLVLVALARQRKRDGLSKLLLLRPT